MRTSLSARRIVAGCTVVALAALGGATASASGQHVGPAVDNWTTYHQNQSRQGYDALATPATGSLSTAWTTTLDGAVYAEPLVVNEHIIVVTEHDTIYSLDLAGDIEWHTNLGNPVPGSELPCGNIDPLGITGTPMVDVSSGLVYFVAELDNPIRHRLFAVDVSSGDVAWSRNVDPAGSTPRVEQQRGAMAIAQGRVWVSYGALAGDCGPYHGYEVGVRLDGTGSRSIYTTPSQRGAGIWAPTGPSVDSAGHLYVAPANGAAFAPPYDDSDSIVKLDGNQKISLWAPDNWAEENADDRGQGPAAPLLFNALGQRWGFVVGKAGHLYLLHAGNLGGIGGQAAQRDHCRVWAGMAYHAHRIYVPCLRGMAAYTIRPGPTIKMLWQTDATGYGAAPVIGGGALWSAYDGTLLQLDPADGATVASIAIGDLPHFATPTLHGALVLVGTLDGVTAVSTSRVSTESTAPR